MTGKERIIKALQLKEPDHVPHFEIGFDREVKRKISPGNFRIADYFKWDATLVDDRAIPGYRQETFGSRGEYFRDQWGVTRKVTTELIAYPVEPAIKSEADLWKWKPPDPDLDWRYTKIRETVRENQGEKAIMATFADPFDVGSDIRGAVNFFADFIRRPDAVDYLITTIGDYYARYIRNCAEAGVDIIFIAGDYATATGPMVSPQKLANHVIPTLKKLVETAHRHGIYVIKHSDGNIMPLVEMILSTGINGLHPIDPNGGMNLLHMKKEFGHRVCLLGNVDCSYTLSWGTVQEVRAEVKKCIRDAAAGGGYICTSSNSIHSAVKPENYIAMVEAIREYGQYPIQFAD
jgi:uroporphyrinogen decarboxylase